MGVLQNAVINGDDNMDAGGKATAHRLFAIHRHLRVQPCHQVLRLTLLHDYDCIYYCYSCCCCCCYYDKN